MRSGYLFLHDFKRLHNVTFRVPRLFFRPRPARPPLHYTVISPTFSRAHEVRPKFWIPNQYSALALSAGRTAHEFLKKKKTKKAP